jgi:type III secretion protein S
MDIATLSTDVKQALMLVLMLSMPVVVTVGVVGLLLAFLQAVTQMQDQTMAFGIKLVTAVVVIALMSGWLGGELFTFADGLFMSIATVR